MDSNRRANSDDEEDLEALRMAALQSLKKKSQPPTEQGQFHLHPNHFGGSPKNRQKRGKFGRPNPNWNGKSGQFNNWTRNSNLISIPVISNEEQPQQEAPKLILPQDRYCKLSEAEKSEPGTHSSKFDRYDNSDESDSDSENDERPSRSEKEEEFVLKKSDSLEALMAELENEIQGNPKQEDEKSPPKTPKKKRKPSVTSSGGGECDENKSDANNVAKENQKPDLSCVQKPSVSDIKKKPIENRRSELGDINRKHYGSNNFSRHRKWEGKPFRHNYPPAADFNAPPGGELIMPYVPAPSLLPPTVPSFIQYSMPMPYDNSPVYQPPVAPPVVFDVPPPPITSVYDRPLSPLTVNTDAFTTPAPTFAPLSPRSAAFVLENRAIIEKRKRRSYSRSPSPLRYRRSKSPKRESSFSPPKKRSMSPPAHRKVLLPKRTDSGSSPKKTVHDRLGVKTSSKTENDNDKDKKPPKVNDKEEKAEILDPVLEARRRKFENNQLTMKEGVIRLKVKEDKEPDRIVLKPVHDFEHADAKTELDLDDDDIDEDALLEGADDTIDLDPKIDVLFSDEEEEDDNEGRFKAKQESNQKVVVLPFTKLVNGSRTVAKRETPIKISEKKQINQHRLSNERRKRLRSKSPGVAVARKTAPVRKASERAKPSVSFPIDSRKIEIKIRNPSKYEGGDDSEDIKMNANDRKVEISRKAEPEASKKSDSLAAKTEESNEKLNEGDLRAQLSRKRAERQKHPLPDVVPTRLLQTALEEVGFKKEKKNKKRKEEKPDGKLPIRLRLGTAKSTEMFVKKSRKRKSKGGGGQEQV